MSINPEFSVETQTEINQQLVAEVGGNVLGFQLAVENPITLSRETVDGLPFNREVIDREIAEIEKEQVGSVHMNKVITGIGRVITGTTTVIGVATVAFEEKIKLSDSGSFFAAMAVLLVGNEVSNFVTKRNLAKNKLEAGKTINAYKSLQPYTTDASL